MKRGDNAPQHSTHRGKATRPSPEATIPRGRDQKNLGQGAKEDHPRGRGGHVRQGTNQQTKEL